MGTGGDDHAVDIWDIRKRGRIYTIPSHTNLVSHLKFQSKTSLTLKIIRSLYYGHSFIKRSKVRKVNRTFFASF